MDNNYLNLIQLTSKSEFPMDIIYYDKLCNTISKMCNQLLNTHKIQSTVIDNALSVWSKGLKEISSANKSKDFSAIKDKKLQKRIIELNTSDTVSPNVEAYQNRHEVMKGIYYYDVILFLGLLQRVESIETHIIEQLILNSDLDLQDLQNYKVDYATLEKQRRLKRE